MTAAWPLFALLAASPCEDGAAQLRALAKNHEQLEQTLRNWSASLGLALTDGDAETEQSDADRVKRAAEKLPAACALAQRAAAPAPDLRRLNEILLDPEYERTSTSGLGVFWQWLLQWLRRLLRAGSLQGFASATRVGVLVAALAVAIAVLLRAWAVRRRELTPETTGLQSPPAKLLPSPEHLARARAQLASAPREALREALLALLSALEARRYARPERVRTNRELAEELPLRGAPVALAERVKSLLGAYDASFYSLEPVATQQAEQFLVDVEKLERDLNENSVTA